MGEGRGTWAVLLTFLLALLLTVMPMPEWARPFRPAWYQLVLIFWVMSLPHRIGIAWAFVLGIFADILTGATLGLHALGMSLLAYLVGQTHLRLRLFPLWQQSLMVLLMLLLERTVSLWGLGLSQEPMPDARYWISPFVSGLLWSWIFILLRDVRRRFVD